MSAQVPMIDVSANNHITDEAIQWPRVKAAGYGAVMIKATEGTTYTIPWLARDATGAQAAGLKVGYYHYAHPDLGPPALQVTYALNAIDLLPRALGLALDLEDAAGLSWTRLAAWARGFHLMARTVVDHSPLYVNDNFLANLPGAPWGERLWLAQTARPRQQVWAWQTTTPVAVPGTLAPTDVGYLHPDA